MGKGMMRQCCLTLRAHYASSLYSFYSRHHGKKNFWRTQVHFAGVTGNSSSLGMVLEKAPRCLFENQIQKLFFLFIKTPDHLKQSCNSSMKTGFFNVVSFGVSFLLQWVQLFLLPPDRPKRTLYSKKYGVDLIRYTHAANTVVYSSNKIDGKWSTGVGRI